MAKFLFDTDDLTEEEQKKLACALAPVAEAEVPLTVEVMKVDEDRIKSLNASFRNVDAVTDVLSFPSMSDILGESLKAEEHEEDFDGESLFLGSVVVCEKRAREQAQEYGHSFEREFFYLTVHGVLHCLGYDHMNDEEKRVMRAKEEEVMSRMNLGIE